MAAKDAVGQYGERVAVRHLQAAGMVVLDRNWRCREGEIDVIARDGGTLVFCEVKTRRTTVYGTPAEAVVAAKAARLRRLALRWLTESGLDPADLRFDVVAVLARPRGAADVEHLRDVL
ncbi:MAG TPA: YraN family protein [Mycobacteriales bacterium]|jgi:putative endonuclease|nr:YraN family protein [Mycobacteriales bacterium]